MVDADAGPAYHEPSLIKAAKDGNAKEIRAVMGRPGWDKKEINDRDDDVWMALHHASAGGHTAAVVVLMASGADPTRATYDGRTAEELADRPTRRRQGPPWPRGALLPLELPRPVAVSKVAVTTRFAVR